MQTVHLVEAVHVRLERSRSCCEQHSGAHATDREQAAELEEHVAKGEVGERLGPQRIGHQPDAP
jgi:hypothetical protein